MTGCSKVSPGCAHCYAEAISLRFERTRLPWTRVNSRDNIKLHEERLIQPLKWRQPRLVFVNSMSDLFHEDVPAKFIDRTIAAMSNAAHHTYQVLTKRPQRALQLFHSGSIRRLPDHVWLGVSIESSRFNWRAEVLREIPARVRFLSAEPLLGSLFEDGRWRSRLNLDGIDWVIVGGESGPHARAMNADWVREMRAACRSAHIPFFFKQWGGRTPKAGGRLLDGIAYDEMPSISAPSRRTASLFHEDRCRVFYPF